QLGFEADWLYDRGAGLTWFGALIVFAVAAAANSLWNRDGGRTRERVRRNVGQAPAAKVGLFVAILAIMTILPLLLGTAISEVLGSVMIYVLLGLGLNIVVGYAGQLGRGYVAFCAVGGHPAGHRAGAFRDATAAAATPARSADVN